MSVTSTNPAPERTGYQHIIALHARSLFDSPLSLDAHPEYMRGVVEAVQFLIGLDPALDTSDRLKKTLAVIFGDDADKVERHIWGKSGI